MNIYLCCSLRVDILEYVRQCVFDLRHFSKPNLEHENVENYPEPQIPTDLKLVCRCLSSVLVILTTDGETVADWAFLHRLVSYNHVMSPKNNYQWLTLHVKILLLLLTLFLSVYFHQVTKIFVVYLMFERLYFEIAQTQNLNIIFNMFYYYFWQSLFLDGKKPDLLHSSVHILWWQFGFCLYKMT